MSVISRVYSKLTVLTFCQHPFKYCRQFSVSQELSPVNCARTYHLPHGAYKELYSPLLSLNSLSSLTVCRTIKSQTSSKREERFKLKDAIPPSYELIYKAPMDTYMAVAQSISTVSSLIFLGVGISKFTSGTAILFPTSIDFGVGSVLQSNEQMIIMVGALILANISLQYIAFSYPLRIYHYNRKYIAIFIGLLPFQTMMREFKCGDVKQAKSHGVSLPWHGAKFVMGRKNVFLLEDYFRRPADFTSMLSEES